MNKNNSELLLQKMLVEHCIDVIPSNSNKKVFYVMKGNGIWQVRKNDIGTFYIHQVATSIPGLSSDLSEGWKLNVPLIPSTLLKSAISFFRAVYNKYQSEAYVQFFYDTKSEEYILHCPKQIISGSSVSYEHDRNFEKPERLLVLEIHSHGSMKAFFSAVDNKDEKDDRFFGVIGCVNQYSPEIKLRLSIGGNKINVEVGSIFDIEGDLTNNFPEEWLLKIKKKKIKTIKPIKSLHNFSQLEFSHLTPELDEHEIEMAKFHSRDYLYPSDSFVPENDEYYLEEGNEKCFVQNGKKLFYIDSTGKYHLPEENNEEEDDEEEEDDGEDDYFDWKSERF